ncbi:hypothetical protein HPT25_27295 [Bacillus sp. BRMEA1]|uniref:hypothetical protein n=1 Tax=Neobacillus endophyticus TaxID=2738405 RepID=UPI001564D24D|nr:hypothetical protein [Neobacillus endophyticus]NRD81028.1 hypothetical protein [Neobacillus endophyticus]
MNKKHIIILSTFIMAIGILAFYFVQPKENVETINLNKTKEEVLKQIISTSHTSDAGVKSKNETNQQSLKKEVAEKLILGLYIPNVDLFLSSFAPKIISKDLFSKKEIDKTVVANEMMDKITRNGKIARVKFINLKGYFNRDTDKFALIIRYKDNKQVKITLQTTELEISNKNARKTFVIKTSAWEIIRKIEGQI